MRDRLLYFGLLRLRLYSGGGGVLRSGFGGSEFLHEEFRLVLPARAHTGVAIDLGVANHGEHYIIYCVLVEERFV